MHRAPAALLAALLLAALPACDGPLLFAELSVPSLRATLPSQSFPASDTTDPADWCAAMPSDPPCIQMTIDYDLGGMVPILNEPGVTYDLRLTDVAIALSATEAGKDLGGIQRVTLGVLTDPADPASAVIVAAYVRPAAGGAPPTAIAVTGNSNLDLGPYLRGGVMRVHVELVLDGGTPAFLADVTSGFSLEVQLDYGSLL
jgi:hypothetical protein